MQKKCVAVVSGGPDSIGYAAIWKSRGFKIFPICFNYGQKGKKEVQVQETYMPNVVVPLRNGVFLMIAAAYADSINAELIIYGAHLNDAAHRPGMAEPLYPDCTPDFAESLEVAINKGRQGSNMIKLQSPAREGLTKSSLLKVSYGLIGDALYETWSCYLSGEIHCGRCESCNNRKKAFKEAGIEDKTKYLN